MPLQRVATWKDTKKEAVLLVIDGVKLEVTHVGLVSLDTNKKIEDDLNSQASTSNVQPPPIFAHINRDGSVAIATGAAPDVWSEDE